ncbi:MAG: glycosyltransferase family 61 protein [Alphaproteobacteria bacterium]|nr:glycosyltransferase family 61 protein [Alphaproteobacteria bacterium]
MRMNTLEIVGLREVCQKKATAADLIGADENAYLAMVEGQTLMVDEPEFWAVREEATSIGKDCSDFSFNLFDFRMTIDPFVLAKLKGARLRNGCHTLMVTPNLAAGESYHNTPALHRLVGGPRGFFPVDITLSMNGQPHNVTVKVYPEQEPDQIIEQPFVVISSRWAENYFHWLADCLPRLACFDFVPELRGTPILIPAQGPAFQNEILAALGFDKNVIRFTGAVVGGDQMYYPSFFCPGGHSRQQIDWLRDKLRAAYGVPAEEERTERLYITRAGSRARRLVNEDDVTAYMRRNGFKVIQPETMSFGEQVRLFSRASVLAMAHGAGCANVMLCRPGATLIELIPDTSRHPGYWILAKASGMKYGRLLCASTPPPIADMQVDMGKLDTVVQQVLAS